MFILLLLFVFSLLLVTYFYMHNTEHGKLMRKIPGDEGYPLIGCIFKYAIKPMPLFYMNRTLINKYKNIYKARCVHISAVVINDPEDIEIILTSSKHIHKGQFYSLFRTWLGDGLLLSSGDKWHKRRKLLTQSFHFAILKDACKIFNEHGKRFVEYVKTVKGQEIEVDDPVAQFALHSLCESVMGISLENKSKEISEYRKAIADIAQCILYRHAKLLIDTNFITESTPVAKTQKMVTERLHKFTDAIIAERRNNGFNNIEEEMKDSDDFENSDDGYKTGKRQLAMLDLLLSMEREGKIDQSGIREEVDSFTFAGHDTTSSCIRFFLLNLANHKDIQNRLVEDLKSKINSCDDKVTLGLIKELPYLDRCLKESLRLYPPVAFVSRYLKENLKLKNYEVPKDSSICIFPFDLHRDYTLYPNPFKYDPERFTPENCAKRHPFAYLPFSAGPRNCIGQKYAIFEVKSFIITLLRNFVVHPVTTPDTLKFTTDITLKTTEPIKVKLESRVDVF